MSIKKTICSEEVEIQNKVVGNDRKTASIVTRAMITFYNTIDDVDTKENPRSDKRKREQVQRLD